jgi:nucleoside-diphosphate-sugar epimerase
VKIFLTGATGFIGSHILDSCLAQGHRLVCLVRSSAQANLIEAKGAQAWVSSTNDQSSLVKALAGMDVLIHAAGCRDLAGPVLAFEHSNIDLTRSLVEAAIQVGVKQFIYISAASLVMSEPMPILNATESYPVRIRDYLPYTRSKVLAEQTVLAAKNSAMRVVILRPSFVWGNGDSVDREIGPASNRGQFGWFSQGHYPFATCSIANLCDALQGAMLYSQSGHIFNVSDREPIEFRAFMQQRLEAGGYRVPTFSVPRALAWRLGAFTENGWKYLPMPGKPPIVREMVRLMGFAFTVSIERANHELGYTAPHSITAGMQAIASHKLAKQGISPKSQQ